MKNYYITESGRKFEIIDSKLINLHCIGIVEVVIIDLPKCIKLDLSHNKLISVDINLPKCDTLYLQDNNLESVDLNLPECNSLYLCRNRLESVGLNIPKCETLSLNYNNLNLVNLTLPKCKLLLLNYNKLESVDLNLSECNRLDLDNNNLESVDLSLPKCEALYLDNNKLESIDLDLPECLKLDLHNNKLESVEINLPKVTCLKSDLIRFIQSNGDIVIGSDGVPTIVDSEKKLGEFTIYSGRYKRNNKKVFVASRGKCCAHGNTMKKAIEDCNFKFLQATVDVGPYFAECKEKGVMSVSDYRLLTGACESGCNNFLESKGIECQKMKFDDAMELLEENKPYGWSKIKELI